MSTQSRKVSPSADVRTQAYKTWEGYISQSGENNPTGLIFYKDFDLKFVRVSTGKYRAYCKPSGLFHPSLTIPPEEGVLLSDLSNNLVIVKRESVDSILIETYDSSGSLSDNILSNTWLSINVALNVEKF